MARQSTCRDCGLPIRWATTTNGKKIALMQSPDPDGRYIFIKPGLVRPLRAFEVERHRIEVATGQTFQQLWLPHITECPARRPDPHVADDVIEKALATVRKGHKK